MPDTATLFVFMTAAAVLLVTPGPAVLYIVARSIDQGRLAGVVSVVGVSVGTLVHVVGAAFGVSAVLASSALAFSVVKYLGAAYLIYLGVRKLREQHTPQPDALHMPQPLPQIFRQGVLVNLLNPKTALFFLAFLPQFVDPANGAVTLQVLFLGLLLVGMGLFSDGTYALLAGTLGHWLRRSLTFWRVQGYLSGGIYIMLGVTAALAGSARAK